MMLLALSLFLAAPAADEWITPEAGYVVDCEPAWSMPVDDDRLRDAVALLAREEVVKLTVRQAERLAGRKVRPARGEFPVLARAVRTSKNVPTACRAKWTLRVESDGAGDPRLAPVIVLVRRMPEHLIVDAGL